MVFEHQSSDFMSLSRCGDQSGNGLRGWLSEDGIPDTLIHLTNIYWLCNVPGTKLGTGNPTVNKTDRVSVTELIFYWRRDSKRTMQEDVLMPTSPAHVPRSEPWLGGWRHRFWAQCCPNSLCNAGQDFLPVKSANVWHLTHFLRFLPSSQPLSQVVNDFLA